MTLGSTPTRPTLQHALLVRKATIAVVLLEVHHVLRVHPARMLVLLARRSVLRVLWVILPPPLLVRRVRGVLRGRCRVFVVM